MDGRLEYLFSVLVPYQRSAAFTPLQRWTNSDRLRIHEPRPSANVEAASRPRSFGKTLNTYLLESRPNPQIRMSALRVAQAFQPARSGDIVVPGSKHSGHTDF